MSKQLVSIACLALLLPSCGIRPLKSLKKYNPFKGKEAPPEKTYSADTSQEFEDIERANALEHYRKIRWQRWESYIRSSKKKRPKRHKAPRRRKARPATTSSSKIKIQIDQTLTYFCMKRRKEPRFKKIAKCNAYTQGILNRCSKQNNHRLNRKLLGCVKRRLK